MFNRPPREDSDFFTDKTVTTIMSAVSEHVRNKSSNFFFENVTLNAMHGGFFNFSMVRFNLNQSDAVFDDNSSTFSTSGDSNSTFFTEFKNISEINTINTSWIISSATNSTRNPDADAIDNIFGPLGRGIFALGLVGNFLSFTVMCSQKFASLPLARVIQCLAVCDSLVLITDLIMNHWFIQVTGFQIANLSTPMCQIVNWFGFFSPASVAWLVSFIAIERYISIWYPFKAKHMITMKAMGISLALLVTILICYVSLWTGFCWGLENGKCVAVNKGMDTIFFYVGIIFFNLIPLLLIAGLNILIIFKLCVRSKQAITTSSNQQAKTPTKASAMLVAVVLSYCLLCLPSAIFYIIITLMGYSLYDLDTLPTMELYIASQIVYLCLMLNSSLNFVLYIIWGETFRTQLICMFCNPCIRRN